MPRKAHYIIVGKTTNGKDLLYKFYAGDKDYQGLANLLGIYDDFDPSEAKVTTAGTFASYPRITQVRLRYKSGGSIVRLADTNFLPLTFLSTVPMQGGPQNLAIEEIKFVRQRRRK